MPTNMLTKMDEIYRELIEASQALGRAKALTEIGEWLLENEKASILDFKKYLIKLK